MPMGPVLQGVPGCCSHRSVWGVAAALNHSWRQSAEDHMWSKSSQRLQMSGPRITCGPCSTTARHAATHPQARVECPTSKDAHSSIPPLRAPKRCPKRLSLRHGQQNKFTAAMTRLTAAAAAANSHPWLDHHKTPQERLCSLPTHRHTLCMRASEFAKVGGRLLHSLGQHGRRHVMLLPAGSSSSDAVAAAVAHTHTRQLINTHNWGCCTLSAAALQQQRPLDSGYPRCPKYQPPISQSTPLPSEMILAGPSFCTVCQFGAVSAIHALRLSPVCRDNACCPVSKDDLLAAVREVALHLAGGVVEHIQAVRVCALPHSHLHT